MAITTVTFSQDFEVIFTSGEFEPFVSESMPGYGMVSEIVTAACKESGIKPIYKFYPWVRTEANVKNGESFAAFPYFKTSEREKLFDYSDPLFYGEDKIFYYGNNPKITEKTLKYKNLADLKEYNFGGVRGYYYEKDFEENKIKFSPTIDIHQSFDHLKSGKIDLIIENENVTNQIIKKYYPADEKNFKTLEKSYGEKRLYYLIVSRKYKNSNEILQKFNKGLKKIKTNGQYDKIIKKYQLN